MVAVDLNSHAIGLRQMFDFDDIDSFEHDRTMEKELDKGWVSPIIICTTIHDFIVMGLLLFSVVTAIDPAVRVQGVLASLVTATYLFWAIRWVGNWRPRCTLCQRKMYKFNSLQSVWMFWYVCLNCRKKVLLSFYNPG